MRRTDAELEIAARAPEQLFEDGLMVTIMAARFSRPASSEAGDIEVFGGDDGGTGAAVDISVSQVFRSRSPAVVSTADRSSRPRP